MCLLIILIECNIWKDVTIKWTSHNNIYYNKSKKCTDMVMDFAEPFLLSSDQGCTKGWMRCIVVLITHSMLNKKCYFLKPPGIN